jgi:hypothetical protein
LGFQRLSHAVNVRHLLGIFNIKSMTYLISSTSI